MHKIQQFTDPALWRIVRQGEGDNETEEVIFTIRGVIHTKNLPLIKTKPKYAANKIWVHDTDHDPKNQDTSTEV